MFNFIFCYSENKELEKKIINSPLIDNTLSNTNPYVPPTLTTFMIETPSPLYLSNQSFQPTPTTLSNTSLPDPPSPPPPPPYPNPPYKISAYELNNFYEKIKENPNLCLSENLNESSKNLDKAMLKDNEMIRYLCLLDEIDGVSYGSSTRDFTIPIEGTFIPMEIGPKIGQGKVNYHLNKIKEDNSLCYPYGAEGKMENLDEGLINALCESVRKEGRFINDPIFSQVQGRIDYTIQKIKDDTSMCHKSSLTGLVYHLCKEWKTSSGPFSPYGTPPPSMPPPSEPPKGPMPTPPR
tara:strand:+ start:286 stop:1167 length:882 start_codon:yes stop_codon:yes gene_type:complete